MDKDLDNINEQKTGKDTDGDNIVNDARDDAQNDTQSADSDLYDTINQLNAEKKSLINDLQRTRADFENYRKHTDEDIERASQRATEKVIKKLLPVIDILDSATATVPDDIKDNDWAKGVMQAHKNVAKLMGELKIAPIETKVGDKFDHNIHEAISMEDGDGDTEVVAAVMRPGYTYNGHVLRPAMVKVTRK